MQYRLRTLLIVLTWAPPVIAIVWWAGKTGWLAELADQAGVHVPGLPIRK